MTAIGSVDALDDLAEGETILVRSPANGNKVWRRTADGAFEHEGATVDATFFVGYINEGRVVMFDNRPPGPGDWFHYNRHDYFVCGVDGDVFTTLVFYNGVYHTMTTDYGESTLSRMNRVELPERVRSNADSMVRLNMRVSDMLLNTQTQIEVLRKQVAETVVAESGNVKVTIAEPPALVDVTVTVTVSGTADLTVDDTVVRALAGLHPDATITVEPVRFTYTYRYTVPLQPGTCGCSTVERAKVKATLPPRVIGRWVQFVTCSNEEHDPF